MARLGRKPVQPGRVTTAVSLGTVGLFVISMGAGMQSWPFGAAGAAMLVIGVALLTTASMRGADKAFVAGTVTVVKVSEAPLGTDYGRCEMQVLVDAPGHPGQTVVIRDPRVPVIKWPDVGETLPALVAVADARRIKIQWERVGTYGQPYENEAYDSAYVSNDEYEVDPDYGVPLKTDELPHKTAELPLVEDDYSRSDEGFRPPEPVPQPAPQPEPEPEPALSLPRRQPSPGPSGRSEASVAVLEGELVDAEVPVQRSPLTGEHVDMLDFSEMPEPRAATPPSSGAAFTEDSSAKVIITQPNARPASAGSIHGIGYTVMVTDLDRSMQFYRDMLGFYEIDGGPDTVILASGDTRIVLVAARDQAPVNRRLVHLNLEVGDVDAIYEELKIRGVRFTYPPRVVNHGERLELVAAAFKDPDGHGIAITQWKARVA